MVQENPGSLEEDLPQTPEPQPIGLQRSPFGHSPPTNHRTGTRPCRDISLQLYIVFLSLHISVPSLPDTFSVRIQLFRHRGWSLYNQKQQGRSQHVVSCKQAIENHTFRRSRKSFHRFQPMQVTNTQNHAISTCLLRNKYTRCTFFSLDAHTHSAPSLQISKWERVA